MSSEEAVRAVVQQYIDGTWEGDGDKLRDCFHPDAIMSGYLNDKLMVTVPEAFVKEVEAAPSMKTNSVPYKGVITSVEVVGSVASAAIKETGFAGSMAFTDYFHLIDDGHGWKIISKTFTTE